MLNKNGDPLDQPGHRYNAPPGDLNNPPSTVGEQLNKFYFYRRAMVEAQKDSFFMQMADVRTMPKHMGKVIKQYHYLPILDDRNINDQGIDAQGRVNGAALTSPDDIGSSVQHVVKVTGPSGEFGRNLYAEFVKSKKPEDPWPFGQDADWGTASDGVPAWKNPQSPPTLYFSGTAKIDGTVNADAAAAAGAAKATAEAKAKDWAANWGITLPAAATAPGGASAPTATAWGFEVMVDSAAAGSARISGNLYGSARDIGSIIGKLPVLSESGGRVNRVGMTRQVIEGSFENFGFFEEYTKDSLDFDTDAELLGKITGEAVKAAYQVTEDTLQIDLLCSAGTVMYCGTASAVSAATVDGVVGYDDFVKMGVQLDNLRVPKSTRIITGSRMIDTRVINSARYAYCGSALRPTLMKLKDYFGEAAFVPVANYAAAGNVAKGERGAIGDFRFVEVPDMLYWDGAGDTATTVADPLGGSTAVPAHVGAGGKLNVYPILIIGDESFTTIGFQTNGKTVKFNINHKKPGPEMVSRDDPYGKTGIWSIQWWYGFMPLRPERLALMKTAAVI